MKRTLISTLVVTAAITANFAVGADDKIDFEKQIQPILVEHCAKCHGEEKAAGKMRLNTAAAIEEKLKADSTLLVAGKPDESKLFQRLVLPADNPKRMPKGADPLPQDKIALIEEWIKQGAVLTVTAAATAPEPAAPAKESPDKAPVEKVPEKHPLPTVAAAPQAAIDRLTSAGARVTPLFADSKLLDISFAGRAEPAGDAEVALLADVAEQVYTLNLADAKFTPTGFATIAKLKNLNSLHLERSAATDEALSNLAGLDALEYLNVYGTAITDAGLKPLAGLKHLGKLYLWQTKVSYDAAMGLEKDTPGLIVNLGFDHPEVAKRRLATELESAKKLASDAKTDLESKKQLFERAQQDAEAMNARITDIEKQLKDLEGTPAADSQAAAPKANAGS